MAWDACIGAERGFVKSQTYGQNISAKSQHILTFHAAVTRYDLTKPEL
jgi:hypothetical protein